MPHEEKDRALQTAKRRGISPLVTRLGLRGINRGIA
ncbi:hypothetical protein LCGC14_2875720, partial [marine sediment metagenome]